MLRVKTKVFTILKKYFFNLLKYIILYYTVIYELKNCIHVKVFKL